MRREILFDLSGRRQNVAYMNTVLYWAVAVAFTLSCTGTKNLNVNTQVQQKRALIKS